MLSRNIYIYSRSDSKNNLNPSYSITMQSLNADIQGEYHDPDIAVLSEVSAPSFCKDCGAAFPWTTSKLQAARDLAQELEEISTEDRDILIKSLDDLVKDTPQTSVSAIRFKKVVAKIGKEGASLLRDILVDVVTRTAKGLIWGAF